MFNSLKFFIQGNIGDGCWQFYKDHDDIRGLTIVKAFDAAIKIEENNIGALEDLKDLEATIEKMNFKFLKSKLEDLRAEVKKIGWKEKK